MFEFQNPAAFLMLLLIPVLHILRRLKIFTKITYPAVLSNWNGDSFEWKGKFRRFLSGFSKALLMMGFIISVGAFADPVKISQEKVYTSLSTDLVFVMDTSPSMAARDVDGSTRLQAAKDSVAALTKEHDGLRYGLVGLGSNATVFVPPTQNLSIFEEKLNQLQVGILGNGSAIGDGLSTAVCHLASSSAPKKCIILFTDGENNAGEIHPETAAKLAQENNIVLYIVGVGSKGTVPIEYTDPVTGKQYSGYLDSDYNSASLRKIASIGKGHYFEVRTLEDLAVSLASVVKTESVIQNFTYKTVSYEYYKRFIFIALILVGASWILRHVILREKINFHYKKVIIVHTALIAFAFLMMILAYCGFSWGTYFAPVQKSGTAVTFVFDISNSMKAKDCPGGNSRLEAASIYAEKLLSKMYGTSTAVVLSKGEGIPAIPLTEDKVMIESLLEVLSPDLMTAPGTNLGKGILCAKNNFPQNFAFSHRIWVFTDCEETTGKLSDALEECIKAGVPVTFIGFGNTKETEILAGDGKTKVLSSLKEDEILKVIEEAGSKLSFYKNHTPVTYINSNDIGSAIILLNQLNNNLSDNQLISYEAKPIPRYKLFLTLALLAFAFSYIFTEFDFKKVFKKNSKITTISLLCAVFVFTGCSNPTVTILNGTYAWRQKQYHHAVSDFIKANQEAKKSDKQKLMDYSLYDLGTAYQMLGEDQAALERFAQISTEADKSIRFAAFYNSGLIAHENEDYEKAQEYFRKALEIDNSKINAKINLEYSMEMAEAQIRQNQTQALPATTENTDIPDIEKGVFKHIKENDKKQWKNSETPQPHNLENDY